MDILKRIMGLIGSKKGQFIWSLLLILLIVASRLVGPFITRVLVDDVIGQSRSDLLAIMLVALLGFTVVRSSLQYLRGFLSENVSQFVVYHMRRNMYRHLQELPFRFYDQHQIGDIMSRMTGDIEGIRHFLAGGVPQVVECVIMFIGAIVMLFSMNAILAVVALLTCPFIAVIGLRFDKSIGPIYRQIREQNAVLNTKTLENVSGVRVVKAFAMEEYEKESFRVENQKVLDYNLRAVRSWARFFPAMDFLSQITTPLLMLVGGGLVIQGDSSITLGMLVAFMGYMWMISMPLRMLGQLINMVENAISSAEKIFYYTDMGSSIKEKPDATAPKEAQGHVIFDHVSFRYGDTDILRDISFDAPPGKTVAIMGATGSGKTTVTNLLARFYDVSQGAVKIDGIDVRDYKLHELRRHIGYVFQETFLFSDTMKDNVAFGVPDANWDTVHQAADVAQASEFISELPQGYDTIVGDRGLGLSGGQKQRTAIARAIAISPRILVLDDATSAVDMETEYAIQKGLEGIMKQRTTFIIAHRISSVKNADEIIVLKDGTIAERGNHHALLEQQGLYYQMYMDQYRDFEMLERRQQGEVD